MDFRLPELGEGVYEAELVAWLVKAGDAVKRGQNLMEVLTDKATMEVPSPFAGTIGALQAKPAQIIKVGDVVLAYTPVGGDAETKKQPEAEARTQSERKREAAAAQPNGGASASVAAPPLPAVAAAGSTRIAASPSVRYMARKLGIDLARVRGSGPQGR